MKSGGWKKLAVVPASRPNEPMTFSPQHFTAPVVISAQACLRPDAVATTAPPRPPSTRALSVFRLADQQVIRPSLSTTQKLWGLELIDTAPLVPGT